MSEGYSSFRRPHETDPPERDALLEEERVREIVRDELASLLAALSASGDEGEGDVPALLATLVPSLQQAILDAVRLGMSLQAREGQPFDQPEPGREFRSVEGGTASVRPVRDAKAGKSGRNSGLLDLQRGMEEWEPRDSALQEVAPGSAGSDTAAWLVNGQMTLVVSPFNGFREVQQFLRDLGRVPRVYEVKPRRVSRGRLFATLVTEYGDAQTLADALESELAPYGPRRRSVQNDLIELLLRPAPATAEAGSDAESRLPSTRG